MKPKNFSTAASPRLKPPSKHERRSGHRRHTRDLLDACQLQHPLRVGYEAVALRRDPRLAEAIASGERFAAEHRGGARKTAQAVLVLVERPPRQVNVLSGCY